MNSMTGFGRARGTLGAREVVVQISSVNRRSLDLSLKLPEAWQEMESNVMERVRAVAARGKAHLVVEVTEAGGESRAWDDARVLAVLERLGALAARAGVPFEADAKLLWSVASAQRGEAGLPDVGEAGPVVLELVDRALADFAEARAREGAALAADILPRLESLASNVEVIAARAPGVPAQYRDVLFQRLSQAGLDLDPSDERVLKELAIFADRCDISEEITRLRSHLGELRALLGAGGEVGRKADFMLQEISREIHTIGSKANDLEIARAVIAFKNEAERVREQIQNVE